MRTLGVLLQQVYINSLLQCSATRHEAINEKYVCSLWVIEEDHQKLRE